MNHSKGHCQGQKGIRASQTYKNRKSESRPRNVVLRLGNTDQVHMILRSCKKLKGHTPKIFINQQFPPEVVARRRILQPVFNKARKLKMKANLSVDRLYIAGRMYTVDTINHVPFDNSSMNQKEDDNSIAFLGRFSPFSNFFQAKFTMGNTTYCSTEQFYQQQKALCANDMRSAMDIMMTTDPFKMKRIGDSITPHKSKWQPMNHMKIALQEKFRQNPELLDILVDTADKRIAEASTDKIWGCGITLDDPDVLDQTTWKGKNNMGKLLEALRTEITKP